MIFIWDNGEEFLDHAIWFVESHLDPDAVSKLLNAAVNPFSRQGGVIARVEDARALSWRQNRLETLESWFSCYGDELVDWRTRTVHQALRSLPPDAVARLAARLYPSNAQIVAESLDVEL